MIIKVHIERLVLDGLPVDRHHGPMVQDAVQAELTRLLCDEGVADSLMSGGATPSVRAPEIHLASDSSPRQVGQQIGRAVYGGIGK